MILLFNILDKATQPLVKKLLDTLSCKIVEKIGENIGDTVGKMISKKIDQIAEKKKKELEIGKNIPNCKYKIIKN